MIPALAAALLIAVAAVALALWQLLKRRTLTFELEDTRQISDLANDPVLVGDILNGRILYTNKAFRALLGYEGDRKLESLRIPELHPPELIARSAERIAEVWEKKGMIYSDLPVLHASGEHIDVEMSANLVRFKGQPAILIYARDIRERLRQERAIREKAIELERINLELQETQSQLVQSEKMASLGALAAGVSHELNSPIGSMRTNADVTLRALTIVNEALASPGTSVVNGNPKIGKAIEALRKVAEGNRGAVDRVSEIVRSLQNFARLDESERKKVDLHDGIRSAITLLSHELKDRISVSFEFGELPQIECSPGKLNQVYMNLLTNAIAAIPEKGAIRIRTSVNGDHVELRFTDTGVGIPREQLEKLFDPSFRTKKARVRAGLGLASSYRIMQEHGGSIQVESTPGVGSTFTLKLPLPR